MIIPANSVVTTAISTSSAASGTMLASQDFTSTVLDYIFTAWDPTSIAQVLTQLPLV